MTSSSSISKLQAPSNKAEEEMGPHFRSAEDGSRPYAKRPEAFINSGESQEASGSVLSLLLLRFLLAPHSQFLLLYGS